MTSWQDNSPKENRQSLFHNFGYEITLFDCVHLRQGFSIDNRYGDHQNEMHWGLGGSFFNHFDIDFYHVYSPKQAHYRHGSWGITLSGYRLWKWQELPENTHL